MIAYPDKLSFYHAGTTQQYNLVKIPHHNLWACSQDGGAFRGATYTAEEIAEHFAKGHWREISFAEEGAKERGLVFPFTFECGDEGILYYASGLNEQGRVKIVYEYNGTEFKTTLEELHLKEQIKSGNWTVKSAAANAWDYYFADGVQETPQKPVEAPPEPPKEISALTIKVGSEGVVEATERLKQLAQAIENVNISLESFQAIFEDTRELLTGGVQGQCVTFCCEEQ